MMVYMTSTQQPRPGDRFEHRRHLTTSGPRRGTTCVITAVRSGVVYYHDEPDGMRCRSALAPNPRTGYRGFEVEEVGRWVPRAGSAATPELLDLVPLPSTRDTYVDGVLRNDLTTWGWIAECLGIDDRQDGAPEGDGPM